MTTECVAKKLVVPSRYRFVAKKLGKPLGYAESWVCGEKVSRGQETRNFYVRRGPI